MAKYLDQSKTINFFKWEGDKKIDSTFNDATHVSVPHPNGWTTTVKMSDRIKELLSPFVIEQQIIEGYYHSKVLCSQIPEDVETMVKSEIRDSLF